MSFADKTILITGATNGIGLAGARLLAAEGTTLLLTGSNPDRLDRLRDELPAATVVADDAGDPATGTALAEAVGEARLDGLWLNAGYADVAPVDEVEAAAFDRMMAVNVRGPMLQLGALAGRLTDGASVVVTSSTATYEGSPAVGLYAATKSALVALSRNWSAELAPRGIRVNTLVPGPIETNFRDFMGDDGKEAFEASVLDRVPLQRVGTPDEAAAVALFLLGDGSTYVTGSQYAVDGGLTRH